MGSFYNVCIYRLPVGKSVVTPRSSCGSCGHELGPLDLIPILSYVFSRGRCRYCKASYSMRYMLVELLTGVLFAFNYFVFGYTWELIFGLILSSIVIIVTFIDIDHHIILDRFPILLVLLGIIYHVFMTDMTWLNIVLGGLVGFGFFFIIAVVSVMGGGDIKLMGGLGILLGFPNIILSIYLGFMMGGLFFLPAFIKKKMKKNKETTEVPFGPFLAISGLITFMYGSEIIEWYMLTFMR